MLHVYMNAQHVFRNAYLSAELLNTPEPCLQAHETRKSSIYTFQCREIGQLVVLILILVEEHVKASPFPKRLAKGSPQ